MLARQRQSLIVDLVRRDGAAKVSDLVTALGVSDMTVRRDLDVLAEQGLVEKVHGGAALPVMRSVDEPGFDAKSSRALSEKRAIATAAAELVRPGSAIGLTAGTTTWTLAQRLRQVPDLTVLTNSVRVADVLWAPDRTVVLTGGIRTPSDALVGPVALNAIRSLHLDQVFMGVHGMDSGAGFTTPNLMEAEVNVALVAAARQLVVVADHSKFGTVGISSFARWEDADVLVTDDGLSSAAQDELTGRVGQLVVAQVDSGRSAAS
ncbi:MAG: DeoR/GlpR family DNA-binding transcription regulator [Micromonosporaceae bacterium]